MVHSMKLSQFKTNLCCFSFEKLFMLFACYPIYFVLLYSSSFKIFPYLLKAFSSRLLKIDLTSNCCYYSQTRPLKADEAKLTPAPYSLMIEYILEVRLSQTFAIYKRRNDCSYDLK